MWDNRTWADDWRESCEYRMRQRKCLIRISTARGERWRKWFQRFRSHNIRFGLTVGAVTFGDSSGQSAIRIELHLGIRTWTIYPIKWNTSRGEPLLTLTLAEQIKREHGDQWEERDKQESEERERLAEKEARIMAEIRRRDEVEKKQESN